MSVFIRCTSGESRGPQMRKIQDNFPDEPRSQLLRTFNERNQKADFSIVKKQFSFSNRGNRGTIFCLRVVTERLLKHQQILFVCVVDFNKALDTKRHSCILDAINEVGVDDKDFRLLQFVYWPQKATVELGGGGAKKVINWMLHSQFDKTRRSPLLYNTVR